MKVFDKLHLLHPLQFPKFRLLSAHDGFSLTGAGEAKQRLPKTAIIRVCFMVARSRSGPVGMIKSIAIVESANSTIQLCSRISGA